MEVSMRPPRDDEILEFETSNWNSLFDPWWYPPSILYPGAKAWEVRIMIYSATGDDDHPEVMYFHPDADLPALAHLIIGRMRFTRRLPMPKLIFMENKQLLSPDWDFPKEWNSRLPSIVAYCLQVPVRILCIDDV